MSKGIARQYSQPEITVCKNCFHADVCGDKDYLSENRCSSFADENQLLVEVKHLQAELKAAKADIALCQDCRVCAKKTTWCDQNPDACKGWKWRGVQEDA